MHSIVEGEIEYLEQKGNNGIEKIKEYQEGIKDLTTIEEILESKFESN